MNNIVIMPLLFNQGKSSWLQKGNQPRLSDKNTERWRQEQLRRSLKKRATPAKTAEKVEETIEVKPFDGVKDIKAINPGDYSNLSNYIKKSISPSEIVEKAVLTFMVNMFLNLPDNFYQPGKNYSRNEREFTREQLNVFRNSLSALEILCGEYNFRDSIGNFSNKQTYKLENLGGLLHTEIWDGKGSYHIIYVAHPSNIAPTEFDESLLKHFIKCKDKIPDEKAIITKIANNLNGNGVLILEGSEIKEIPGLRIIDSYNNNVSLYQKV